MVGRSQYELIEGDVSEQWTTSMLKYEVGPRGWQTIGSKSPRSTYAGTILSTILDAVGGGAAEADRYGSHANKRRGPARERAMYPPWVI